MADNAEAIKFMNTDLPNNRDPRADGAAEIRAVKVAIKNCFPNVDGPVSATTAQMNNIFNQGMSAGMIVMWSGKEEEVPKGWALCDGTVSNNLVTPDLRGKFVMGWNTARSGVDSSEVANIGDKSSLASSFDTDLSKYLTSEPTSLTISQIPELEIGVFDSGGNETPFKKYGADNGSGRNTYGPVEGEDRKLKTKGTKGNAHTHKLVANANNGKFDKRPNWYALAFIMYVGTGAL